VKNNELAITSFILAILSWIPLLNFLIAPAAVYYGFYALKELNQQPTHYKGKLYAVTGLLIGLSITIFSYSWLVLKLIK